MNLVYKTAVALGATFLVIAPAFASPIPVPEIDGSIAVIGLGLTAAIVAIVREIRRK